MKSGQRKKSRKNRGLDLWLTVESIGVTVAAVAPFALLHLVNRYYWVHASAILVLGMFLIMGAIVAVTATVFSWIFNKVVSGLTGGLKAVAEGDFSRRLDPKKGGPLQSAYEDLNHMSMELQSIQTLRTDLINHFSHEFKTPITAIKGFAELLREPDTTPEERDQYLQIILDESSRLADLANSTLLLTQLESQQCIAEKPTWSRRSTRAMRS